MSRFTFISETAKAPGKDWANYEVAKFHYFNPNGLIAQKRKLDDAIDALIAEGRAMGGAAIAYGALNYYYSDRLIELARTRRVDSCELHAVIKCFKDEMVKAEAFIAEKTL
jgi:hypothetical protein